MKKVETNKLYGHLSALFTVGIWGMTFISTKILLKDFTPFQILFLRFLLGYILLWLVSPKLLKVNTRKEEGYFALAGILGIVLYYFLENLALTLTNASNVGIIVSVAPFFTVLLAKVVTPAKQVNRWFYIGFLVSLSGIILISLSSLSVLEIHPTGDVLSLLAAMIWAAYSLVTKKISSFGYNILLATRRTFFYGLLFMLPILFVTGTPTIALEAFTMTNVLNLVFLGAVASAVCFVTWNYSVSKLGAVQASVYIYAVPAITVVTSALFLGEKFTPVIAAGTVLTTIGLFVSERSSGEQKESEQDIQ
ncbi:DMT family transporter [Enterococcus sp. BWM-S5]|uniref:DMT family transporter n=1 Tax=Enterococcus larvae TaxID=2794352 RepID=A0ABS4CLI1_9ENTE|nr:DMT family transporter [Enterococcus larvae]MBP1046991.1 DMT family transporter [Enterococcus larvae]